MNFIRTQLGKLIKFTLQKVDDVQFVFLSPKGSKMGQINDKIQFPKNKYVLHQSYLQMFYNSTSQNGRSNGQQLILLTGAIKSGKTSLIKQSLSQFKKRKNNMLINQKNNTSIPFTTITTPQYLQDLQKQIKLDNQLSIILQFDFSQTFMMKQQALFHHIHSHIIKQILKMSSQIKNNKSITLLDHQIVKQIILANNSHQYIFIFLKDVIFSILNSTDIITLSKNGLLVLEEFNQKLIQTNCQVFFQKRLQSNDKQKKQPSMYGKLIKILADDQKKSELQASINLFLSIFKRIQYENRPQSHMNSSYETGIQSTTYLFSILNYICGYGNLNKKILQLYITTNKNQYDKYFIGKGNHIDVIMVLLNIDKLTCYKNEKFNQWLDNIIIQLHNYSNIRSHFPMVIQLDNCYTRKQLQFMGRMEINNPSIMEIPGYYVTNLFRYSPSRVLNQQTIKKLKPYLGRNPSTWNQAIIQLAKGVPIIDIMCYKATMMQRLRPQFHSRLNRIYIQPTVLPYLDNQTLKYYMLQFMIIFKKCKGYMKLFKAYHQQQIYNNQLFQLFYIHNILFQNFYQMGVNFTDQRYFMYVKEQLKKINIIDKIKFKTWKLFYSPFTYFYSELRYKDKIQLELYKHTIRSRTFRGDYHLAQSYGELLSYKYVYYDEIVQNLYNV